MRTVEIEVRACVSGLPERGCRWLRQKTDRNFCDGTFESDNAGGLLFLLPVALILSS